MSAPIVVDVPLGAAGEQFRGVLRGMSRWGRPLLVVTATHQGTECEIIRVDSGALEPLHALLGKLIEQRRGK